MTCNHLGRLVLHSPVLILRPQRLRGGGVLVAWSLLWPRGRWCSRERSLMAGSYVVAGEQLRAALLVIWPDAGAGRAAP